MTLNVQQVIEKAKDLNAHDRALVVITFRGNPCARFIPYQEQKKENEKNELFGMWKDNDDIENVNDYVRNRRKGRF